MGTLRLIAYGLSAALLLSGCDSAEERAEQHYQAALALIAEGDVDRALIELRNVFDDNGFHKEARLLYADTVLAQGDAQAAYGQYLRLIEQYPDTLPVRLTLARLAMDGGAWDEVERHGAAAVELAPDDPEVAAISAALDYRAASLAEDDAARAEAAERAEAILETRPEDQIARRVVIDFLVKGSQPSDALPLIDRTLQEQPDYLEMHVMKLAMLAEAEDDEAVEAQLVQMVDQFPDNPQVQQSLIQWHLEHEDLESAEAVLRDMAGPPETDTEGNLGVVQFLIQTQGTAAARAELERLRDASGESSTGDLWRATIAMLDFDEGKQADAISQMQDIIETAEPSDQTRRIRIMLTRLLEITGNSVGARAEVETVLEEDPTNVDALKLRAAWAIDEDRPDAAINDLRSALSQAPRDPEIMTLMAQAHERAGSMELAGERLALAVEVSDAAPAESARYALFLLAQNRLQAARTVVEDALRRAPSNLDLLALSGDLALRASDWAAADRTIEVLGTMEGDAAEQLASNLRTARLMGENRLEEVTSLLQDAIAEGGDEGMRATAQLALARYRDGDAEGAQAVVDEAIGQRPDALPLRLLSANIKFARGNEEAGTEDLRQIVALAPTADAVVARLYNVLFTSGDLDEARRVLEDGLEAAPNSELLQTILAGERERAGDIEGAIEIYEDLYDRNSSNVIVANNLASLIASHIEGPEALDRAAAIARRLRGREIPAFQDTYGWIEYRRGNLEEALASLEPAAEGLPEDPLVQYHFGLAARDAGRIEDARAALEAAVRLGEGSPLPQIDDARQALEALPPPEE